MECNPCPAKKGYQLAIDSEGIRCCSCTSQRMAAAVFGLSVVFPVKKSF